MSLLYTIKLEDGEIIKDCYFIGYRKPITSHHGAKLIYWNAGIGCFDKNGNPIQNIKCENVEIIKIYDEFIDKDVTDFYFNQLKQIPEGYLSIMSLARRYEIES